MQKGGLFMKYLSKILTFVIVLVMVFSLSIPVFAADASAYPNVIDSVETQNEQIDYASIVERLDIDELDNFIQAEKSSHPEITEKVLEEKLKAKILQDGLDKKIIFIDNDGNITFNKGVTDGSVFYSYSDLPIIKSKLRNNEKRVFNKSLIKGLGVLSSGQTAMSYYKTYYNSTSGYEDDNADAFRHALWMLLAARKSGASYAREFGVAHENDYPSSSLARSMDLFNNNVGIAKSTKIPGNAPAGDAEDLALEIINDAVKNGELRRFKGSDIGTKSVLVKTNAVGSRKK